MGARGRRGLILGLRDLSDGFQVLDARKQKRLADEFEREQFDYRKSQDMLTEKRLSEALAAQIENQAIDNQRARRAGVLGTRDRMFGNMLKKGDLDLATRRENRLDKALSLRGQGGRTATATTSKPTPFDLRQATISLAKSIASEKQAPKVSVAEEEPLSGILRGNSLRLPPPAITMEDRPYEQFMPEASRYTAASDLPEPRLAPVADPLAQMDQDEWELYVLDQFGELPDEAMSSPSYASIVNAIGKDRRAVLERAGKMGLKFFIQE